MIHGVYEVSGKRCYRGHEPGATFVARLDPGAEQRAIARGDIVLVERIVPALEPGSFSLPEGWSQKESMEAPGRRLSHSRR